MFLGVEKRRYQGHGVLRPCWACGWGYKISVEDGRKTTDQPLLYIVFSKTATNLLFLLCDGSKKVLVAWLCSFYVVIEKY